MWSSAAVSVSRVAALLPIYVATSGMCHKCSFIKIVSILAYKVPRKFKFITQVWHPAAVYVSNYGSLGKCGSLSRKLMPQ